MTARYRCPYCGTGMSNTFTVRKHQALNHRKAILADLRLIEAYGTRDDTLGPSRPPTARRPLNPGVSGEGDE